MSYTESYEEQNVLLAERHERVNEYLSKVADSAETKRVERWVLPAGVSAANYEEYAAPLRDEVRQMLGYPPPGQPVAARPDLQALGADEDGEFWRVRVPLLREGLEAYGLLIKPPASAANRRHLAVAIHGGAGTPELAASILGPSNYNDMGRRLARRGHTVWMPACYERTSFAEEPPTPDQVHQALDQRARLVGSTLAAIDAFAIITSTQALLASEHCRAESAIAVGLSYGGFRALLATALSDQFRACVTSCYFNHRRGILESYVGTGVFSDLFWPNGLGVATDVELCYLICPRPLCIEVGTQDELLPVQGAVRAVAGVQRRYEELGLADRFEFDAFAGGHEFSGVKAFQFLERSGF